MANIDESNFRKCAQSAIKKYEKDGKLIDALVWMRIIGLYEAALQNACDTARRASSAHG
jgi:hypothetical protein